MSERPAVRVRRSARRKRTVDARREGDVVVVSIPASMSAAQEEHWVAEMLRRLERSDARRRPGRTGGDDSLAARADALAREHLDGARAQPWPRPASVRWTRPMRTRWASCTPADGTIRIDERLREVPGWVLDYVLVHELVHLREPGHGRAFHDAESRYPRCERAKGYLEAMAVAAGHPAPDAEPDDD